MDSDKQAIIAQVVQGGLDKAMSRAPAPPVIAALTALGWDGTSLAKWMGLTEGRISQWSTGVTSIPAKHAVKLHYLLAQTLAEYDRRITELQAEGLWTLSAAAWLRYRLSNGRGVLTRYRRRSKLAA